MLFIRTELKYLLQVVHAGNGLNDQQWHSVRLTRRATQITLQVDKEAPAIGELPFFFTQGFTSVDFFLLLSKFPLVAVFLTQLPSFRIHLHSFPVCDY